jgi:hypothetical protein
MMYIQPSLPVAYGNPQFLIKRLQNLPDHAACLMGNRTKPCTWIDQLSEGRKWTSFFFKIQQDN